MSDVGNDVKQAYIEVGTRYKVEREGNTVVTGEYLLYDVNAQVTKPFIREFFLEVALPFDTAALTGDVLVFDDGRAHLLVNKVADQLENAPFEHSGVMYKVNVSGELRRYSGETRDALYHLVPAWQTVKANAYGLLVPSQLGEELDNAEVGQLELNKDVLYVPSSYGAKLLDRYVPASGEFHKVVGIQKRLFPNVDMLTLEEDTRE